MPQLLQMLLFWEMTSLTSFLLIGFRRRDAVEQATELLIQQTNDLPILG